MKYILKTQKEQISKDFGVVGDALNFAYNYLEYCNHYDSENTEVEISQISRKGNVKIIGKLYI